MIASLLMAAVAFLLGGVALFMRALRQREKDYREEKLVEHILARAEAERGAVDLAVEAEDKARPTKSDDELERSINR